MFNFLINFISSGKYTEKGASNLSDDFIRYALINFIAIFAVSILGGYAFSFFRRGLYENAAVSFIMLLVCLTAFILARTKIKLIIPAMFILVPYALFCIYIVYVPQEAGANFLFMYIYPILSILLIGMLKGSILSIILLVIVFVKMFFPGLSQFSYHQDAATRMLASYFMVHIFMVVIEITRKTKDKKIENKLSNFKIITITLKKW